MEIPALADLFDLQEVDLQIDRLLDRRQNLPELDRYRTVHEQLDEARSRMDQLKAQQRQLGLELDKAEGELEIISEKLKEAETRLFAGGMSSRETEHKRLEVTSLRGQEEALEEKVLGLLDRKEEIDERVAAAQREINEIESAHSELEDKISSEWRAIDAEIARREARKAEIAPAIPDDLIETYEQLRRTKEGVAVGRLDDGQCGGCHLHLSLTEQAEAAESDPPRCVHCRRILIL